MPTFRPKSEARGRALEVVLWAKAPELTNRIATAAKSLLTIAPDNYQPLIPRTALLFPRELKKKRRGLQKEQMFIMRGDEKLTAFVELERAIYEFAVDLVL
jgi:hypothetical protein